VIVEHDWEAFSALSRMTNHWDRPGWPDGGRAYYWMLTFTDTPSLVSRVRHCQSALAHLAMDPIPDDGLHVTMTRVGDTAHVPLAQVRNLAALAEQLPLTRFQVLAHPLAGSQGAVRLTLSPWTPLVRLHKALRDLGLRVGVPGGVPTSAFRPHLGIQYSNRDQSAGPVIESVASLRSLEPVLLDIASVDLVELRRTCRPQRSYRWNVLHQVFLGPRSAAPSPPGRP
jgi:2'-5' RNA ligase